MRTAQEIIDTAVDEPPFSNGTELYGWMDNWCWRCHNPVETAWQDYEDGKRKAPMEGYPGGCPMIMAATIGKTPVEWLPQGNYFGDQYHCIEFRGDDGDDPEPQPVPDPPGMDALFERPERSVRMLKQPVHEEVLT